MKKIFLNESEKQKYFAEKEKMILESFAKTYNKIKRVDENEINQVIPQDIFSLEKFEPYELEIVETPEPKEIIVVNFTLVVQSDSIEVKGANGMETKCYQLEFNIPFYYKYTSWYRKQTRYEPEEGPETEFYFDIDQAENIRYVDCSNEDEVYQLTDEMKNKVISEFKKHEDYLKRYIEDKKKEERSQDPY
jgi:hypothetical protein